MRTPFQWAEDQRLDRSIPMSPLFRHRLHNLLSELVWWSGVNRHARLHAALTLLWRGTLWLL